ncbi:MAG: C39 family peptidase [Vicinamibacterales bacterium]
MLIAAAVLVTAAATVSAQPASSSVRFLDVPYIQQSEALCGGAAAAMVMRYWGATGIYAESFAPLVDEAAGGIRADALLNDLRARGWDARSFGGDRATVQARLADRQPVVALIEDRPGAYHFVVIVAWVNGRVIYHDPARAPFRVVQERVFTAAWEKAKYWTMLALPPAGGIAAPERTEATPRAAAPATPCDGLIAEGVRAAERGDRDAALEMFTSAGDLCPGTSAPWREAAGVYALEKKWDDAARLARLAVERDPRDEHAWRILATSAYVGGDPAAALKAWNAIGEPVIDLVTVQGLDRTRHAVVTSLLNLPPNTALTSGGLAAAARRLDALPSADAARVTYRPIGSGRANVEAVVVERPRFPSTRGALLNAGLSLVTDREIALSAASVTSGGDRVTAQWRWWEARPRVSLAYEAPSRVGVWRTEVFGEKETYGAEPASVVESRQGGSLALSNWTTTLLRWEVAAGIDHWRDRGRTATVTTALDQRLAGEAVALRGGATGLAGAFTAWSAGAAASWRSRARHEGAVFAAVAGVDVASTTAPLALWPGAGTGHARGPLLRAHPLLDDGRVTGDVFGRRLYHGSVEGRHWLKPVMRVLRIAPAVFVDAARAERRRHPGAAWHIDAGAGVRLAFPGSSVLRIDVGKGLRDGATAFSVGWAR